MTDVKQLITEHLDIWLTAETEKKSGRGRSSGSDDTIYGVKKLRELILTLALTGKLIKTSSEWKNYTLDQVGVWAIGSGFPKNAQGQQNEEILFCKVSDMNLLGNEKYINDTNHSISLATAKQLKTKVHNVGTVIFPKIGGAIATNKRRILTKPTAIDNNCLGISPHNFVDSEWLYLLLKNIDFSEYQAGTSVPALQQAKIAKIKVYVPSLEDQHKVINEVKNYRRLCDQLEQQQTLSSEAHATLVDTLLKALTESNDADEFQDNWQRIVANFDLLFTTEYSIEQLKQTVLQLAVMGKLVKQDPSDEPASELLKKIADEKAKLIKEGKIKKTKPLPEISEDEKPFELPSGWEFAWKKELFNFLNGYAFKSEWFDKNQCGMKLLRNINISHGYVNWDETVFLKEEFIEDFQSFALEENDIVLTLDRPLISTGLKYAILRKEDLPCYLLQRVAKFQAFKEQTIFVKYLELWINSKFFISNIDQGRSNGVPHISTAQVEKMVFALPPFNEQKRIVEKVDQLFSMINQLQVLQNKLQKTKLHLADALVANAVEGV
ncbi:restriction endonuclease subunit S [Acinetobacter johnsonii]|uniref:restriction endonuclease subunit S n=1 Tax=Acinetobacter johnsonii TaxID=40214 RepID=UPI0025750523|nr:restriction endonuclease subunit S [Acinetobacter johnsonii]MDM1251414.1 restriction endonuclease subunit S [Acinetobacter johnsonii]